MKTPSQLPSLSDIVHFIYTPPPLRPGPHHTTPHLILPIDSLPILQINLPVQRTTSRKLPTRRLHLSRNKRRQLTTPHTPLKKSVPTQSIHPEGIKGGRDQGGKGRTNLKTRQVRNDISPDLIPVDNVLSVLSVSTHCPRARALIVAAVDLLRGQLETTDCAVEEVCWLHSFFDLSPPPLVW